MKNLSFHILLGLVLSANLYGYRLNRVAEAGARWAGFPVSMKLNPTNSGLPEGEVDRVISKAMQSWNSGIGKDVLDVYDIDYSANASEAMDSDGDNVIAFSNNFRSDSNGFDPDIVVAVGGQYGNGKTMSDGFVLFNSEQVSWDTDQEESSTPKIYSDDLETITVHELGHVLGLGHSEQSSAIMSGQRSSRIKRELTTDDIEGGIYLTGATGAGAGGGRSAQASSAGCGSIKGNNNSNSNIMGMLMMMLLPALTLTISRIRIKVSSR